MVNAPSVAPSASPQRFLVLNVDPTTSRAKFTAWSKAGARDIEAPARGQLFIDPERLTELSGVLHLGVESRSNPPDTWPSMRLARVTNCPARNLVELSRAPMGVRLLVETRLEYAGSSAAVALPLHASAEVRDGQLVGVHLVLDEPISVSEEGSPTSGPWAQVSDGTNRDQAVHRVHLTGRFDAVPGQVATPSHTMPPSRSEE